MRTATLMLMAALVALCSCGVRRPLMRPEDVPAYEARRAKRAQQLQEDSNIQPLPDVEMQTPLPSAAPQPAPAEGASNPTPADGQ